MIDYYRIKKRLMKEYIFFNTTHCVLNCFKYELVINGQHHKNYIYQIILMYTYRRHHIKTISYWKYTQNYHIF